MAASSLLTLLQKKRNKSFKIKYIYKEAKEIGNFITNKLKTINILYNTGKVVGCNYEYLNEKLIAIPNYYVISLKRKCL